MPCRLFHFDHRFEEALVGCACSRTAGGNDGTKRGWDDERKPKRGQKKGKLRKEEKRGREETREKEKER